MCGADADNPINPDDRLGSPPRVRSRLGRSGRGPCRSGITSACAEQTQRVQGRARRRQDHLRACGADSALSVSSGTFVGSPPRVRSRPDRDDGRRRRHGITSACAEQTTWASRRRSSRRDHLRVCGADLATAFLIGLPFGITSACAEQTEFMQQASAVD